MKINNKKAELVSIDHIVLTVKDINRTIKFYCDVLGMELQIFYSKDGGRARKALFFGNQKFNLHEEKNPLRPHANKPLPGSIDICFTSLTPLEIWKEIFLENKVKIEDGPVLKTGANGPIMSIYIRDPDLNLIEISNQI